MQTAIDVPMQTDQPYDGIMDPSAVLPWRGQLEQINRFSTLHESQLEHSG